MEGPEMTNSSRYPEITVGMGGTEGYGSDRYPLTVVAVRYAKNGSVKEIDTVGDNPGKNKAVWPAQDYDITPGWVVGQEIPKNVTTWRMDSKGKLRRTHVDHASGRRVMAPANSGGGIGLSGRYYYQDPHF